MRESKFTILLFLLFAKLQVALAGFYVPIHTEHTNTEFTTKLQVENDSPFAICNVSVRLWEKVKERAFDWREVERKALSTNQSFTYNTKFSQTWAVRFADCGGYLKCESDSGAGLTRYVESEVHSLAADDEHDPVLIQIHAHTITPKHGPSREESHSLFYAIEDVNVYPNKLVAVNYRYSIVSALHSSTGHFNCRWTGPYTPTRNGRAWQFTPLRFRATLG